MVLLMMRVVMGVSNGQSHGNMRDRRLSGLGEGEMRDDEKQ
jgi:hypothetical protein